MLSGYLWILGFPLIVVVPFSCYRSLAREFEDETIHLMTITTMTSYKIVNGKIVSSLLQMVVYLAAITPCIAFTYLLRGVSLGQIFIPLITGMIGSASLCSLALMFAGLSRSLFFRIGIAVMTIVGLLFGYWGWCLFVTYGVIREDMARDESGWIAIVMIMSWIATTGFLCYHAAAALASQDKVASGSRAARTDDARGRSFGPSATCRRSPRWTGRRGE